ncbi:MAG: MetQ/NlpA family ABC transporter substrate-binding protein [Eubacteriales bacterium]|nr:MetQ/NlpA family ABC transporter substrate-binding protein [Eubacteriales bacterium]
MKKVFVLCLILFLGLSFVACGPTASTPADKPEAVNIGILRVPNDEMIAKTENLFQEYFQDKGIEVNFIVFDSGVDANKAFFSGSIDFATMGHTNAVIALSRKLPVELVWIHEVLGEIEALVVKEDSPIQSVEELAGQRVATVFASTSHYSLLHALREAGIEDQVTLLDMLTPDIVAAWERGDIEAAYTWQPTLGEILKSGRVLMDSKRMAEKGVITANVCLGRKEFLENYPDLTADFITVLRKAGDIYRADPAKGAEITAKGLDISSEVTSVQMSGSRWLTGEEEISPEFLGNSEQRGAFADVFYSTGEFLLAQKHIDRLPTKEEVDAFINPEFIEKSLQGSGQ